MVVSVYLSGLPGNKLGKKCVINLVNCFWPQGVNNATVAQPGSGSQHPPISLFSIIAFSRMRHGDSIVQRLVNIELYIINKLFKNSWLDSFKMQLKNIECLTSY